MKSKLVILAAAIAMSHSALAQTTTTATVPATDAAAANASTATTNAATANTGVTPSIKYLGFLFGPALNLSSAHQADINGNDSLSMQHRPQFLVKTSENDAFGIETRFDTNFGGDNHYKTNVQNENYRLMGKFSNVYQSDTTSVTLLPRVMLPTSMKAHDQHMLTSPEMIAWVDYSPKDSRFSFELGADYAYFLYQDQTALSATTAAVQPWAEIDYTISPKVTGMLAWWPDYSAHGHVGSPLAADSYEIDMGAYLEVSKNWKVTPYIAADPYGMDYSAPLKNMQVDVLFIGTVL